MTNIDCKKIMKCIDESIYYDELYGELLINYCEFMDLIKSKVENNEVN